MQTNTHRHLVQAAVLVLTLAIGLQFALYATQLLDTGMPRVARPPGVEGFLPIGALMAWKRFLSTGQWDPVHPAAMVLLGFAVLISFCFRKSFCSWFCPVGSISEALWKAGRRIFRRNVIPPRWLDLPLRSIKYLLLGFFVFIIARMSVVETASFLQSPYYLAADIKMLQFFTRMTPTTAWVLAFLALGSLAVKNFWCRYFCPYGALMGLAALAGPTRIRRDPAACIGCGRCSEACPAVLPVAQRFRILSPECTGCMDCVQACPQAGALTMKTGTSACSPWRPQRLGLVILAIFLAVVYVSRISGHWQSRVPPEALRAAVVLMRAGKVEHPSVRFNDGFESRMEAR